jgi:guanine nucleotide-binding protein G(i) subunit alpha
MKIIHQDGFTPDELLSYRPIIYNNILESAHALITAMEDFAVEPVAEPTRLSIPKVLDHYNHRLDLEEEEGRSGISIPSDVAHAVYQIWQDDTVQHFLENHSSDFYLMDSTAYFFSHVQRIGTPGYAPTTDDVVRARAKSIGITETRFKMKSLDLHVIDVGGQRSERRKWIHCFESVTSILFCTALSEYDQVGPSTRFL